MEIQDIDILQMRPRVFRAEYHGRSCYVKKRILCRRRVTHYIQGAIASIVKSPFLAVTVPDPAVNLALHEAQRIDALHRLGLRVPQVYDYNENYLVLEDCGERVSGYLKSHPEKTQEVLKKAIRTLAQLHRAGHCHGGSQLRNFTVKDDNVYMIDFEEQIPDKLREGIIYRDLLLFLSSLFTLQDRRFCIEELIEAYQSESGRRVTDKLAVTYRRLRFIEALKPLSRLLGRDYHAMLYLVTELRKFYQVKKEEIKSVDSF